MNIEILVVVAIITMAASPPIAFNATRPYCDQVSDAYMASGGICHDRFDVSEITGLATCRNGTHAADPLDCQ